MKNTIKTYSDGEGYISEVEGHPYMYAFGYTPEESQMELYSVLAMLKDFYSEQADITSAIIEKKEYAL